MIHTPDGMALLARSICSSLLANDPFGKVLMASIAVLKRRCHLTGRRYPSLAGRRCYKAVMKAAAARMIPGTFAQTKGKSHLARRAP